MRENYFSTTTVAATITSSRKKLVVLTNLMVNSTDLSTIKNNIGKEKYFSSRELIKVKNNRKKLVLFTFIYIMSCFMSDRHVVSSKKVACNHRPIIVRP